MAKGTIRLLAVMALLAGLQTGAAGAAELKVLSAVALRPALQELAPVFEKSSGHKLTITYDTAGKVAEKITGEDAIDVAILTKPLFDKAARAAKMVDGTRTNLAQQQLGLAVKKGAPKPDISSVEAFKKTLLSAKSIAYGDPAAGGAASIHLAQALEKLGIAAELKPKTKLAAGGDVTEVTIAQGPGALGMTQVSEIVQKREAQLVGLLPDELQNYTVFVGGIPTAAKQSEAVAAFVKFLSSPAAIAAIEAKGMQVE